MMKFGNQEGQWEAKEGLWYLTASRSEARILRSPVDDILAVTRDVNVSVFLHLNVNSSSQIGQVQLVDYGLIYVFKFIPRIKEDGISVLRPIHLGRDNKLYSDKTRTP